MVGIINIHLYLNNGDQQVNANYHYCTKMSLKLIYIKLIYIVCMLHALLGITLLWLCHTYT